MGKKSSPKAPDPYKTADAQAKANEQALLTSAELNRYNQIGPNGSTTWTRPTDGSNQWTQTTTLNPDAQTALSNQERLAAAMSGMANDMAGNIDTGKFSFSGLPDIPYGLDKSGLPSLDLNRMPALQSSLDFSGLPSLSKDYSADAGRVEKATFDRMMGLLKPEQDRALRSLENRLAVMGHPVGSEGYADDMTRYRRGVDEANLNAALEAVNAGRQEQSRLFGIDSQSRGQLANEAITAGNFGNNARGQAISEAMGARGQLTNEQLNDANLALTGRQQGISEQSYARNQPINELAALLGGSPNLQGPNVAQTAQYQMSAPDISGMIMDKYKADQSASQGKKGGATDLLGTVAGNWGGIKDIGSAVMSGLSLFSDIRLKTDIEYAGTHNGHKLYSWNWNDEAGKLGLNGPGFGVLADEVEQYAPHLVGETDGYKTVNYEGVLNG